MKVFNLENGGENNLVITDTIMPVLKGESLLRGSNFTGYWIPMESNLSQGLMRVSDGNGTKRVHK